MSNKGTVYLRKTPRSKIHCEKLSKHMKGKWKDPEYAEKAAKRLKASKQTPEFREKMRKIMIERHKNKKYSKRSTKKMLKKIKKMKKTHLIVNDVERVNDYCGVVNMSDFKELHNG